MEELKEKVKQALEDGTISAFLGLKSEGEHVSPFLVTRDNLDELELLTLEDERYPLTKVLARIVARHPDETIGVMVRGCDERSIIELCKAKQLDPEKIVKFGIACDQQLAEKCHCATPYPLQINVGDKSEGVTGEELLSRIEQMETDERLSFWLDQFGKCIKCYGCRNICPVCYCKECAMEDRLLVPGGRVPPDVPVFHLIKAYHMMERCIDCGLCEQTCPVGIPLRTIYRKMGQVMAEIFDYIPGRAIEEKSPLAALEEGSKQIV